MKNKLFTFCLKSLRKAAGIRQVGNPYHTAPLLTEEPGTEEEVIFKKNSNINGDVKIWRLTNILATALYGGALINEKNEAYTRFLSFPWGKPLHPVFTFPYIGRKPQTLDKAIFMITPEANGNYYHWMIDLLPRLLLIIKSDLEDFKNRFVVLHFPKRSYETETLDLLNIPQENVVRIKPFEMVEIKDLIVSDKYSNERNFPNWKKILLKEFGELVPSAQLPDKNNSKIYLFRGNQKNRRLINEEYLVQILKGQGFQIVDPQKLSLANQITTLKQARIVVAVHGAALTNIIFCEEGTGIIELRSTQNSPEHYSGIAKTYNLNFETVFLPPARLKEKRHHANKENLRLTNESVEVLLSKISKFEYSLGLPSQQALRHQTKQI